MSLDVATFIVTVILGTAASLIALMQLLQAVAVVLTDRAKAESQAIGRWAKYSETKLLWREARFDTVASVPVIWFEDVRVALSQSKFPIRPLRGRAIVGSHTYYACWANMLLDLGIEEYHFPLSRVAVMSLKPDATAPYCYITKETLILCAVLLGCNTLLVQNEILIIRGRRIAIQVTRDSRGQEYAHYERYPGRPTVWNTSGGISDAVLLYQGIGRIYENSLLPIGAVFREAASKATQAPPSGFSSVFRNVDYVQHRRKVLNSAVLKGPLGMIMSTMVMNVPETIRGFPARATGAFDALGMLIHDEWTSTNGVEEIERRLSNLSSNAGCCFLSCADIPGMEKVIYDELTLEHMTLKEDVFTTHNFLSTQVSWLNQKTLTKWELGIGDVNISDGSEATILLADAMRILLAANPNVRLKAHQKTFLCLQIVLLDNYIRQNCSNVNELLRSVLNLTNSDIAQRRIGRIRKLEMRSKDIGRFLPVLVLRAACMLRLLVNSLDCSDYSGTEEGFMQVRLGEGVSVLASEVLGC
jgi:hypothetical protein